MGYGGEREEEKEGVHGEVGSRWSLSLQGNRVLW